MSYAHQHFDLHAGVDGAPAAIAPGKRTLTAALQCKPAAAADARTVPASAIDDGASTVAASAPFWFADGPPHGGDGDGLPAVVQAKMERAFSADFSDVRVHEGGQAAAVGAVAYAQGSELHFQPGAYDPHSASGQELLGHELAHVVQQREGRVSAGPQGKDAPINRDPSLEAEADALGAAAARGEIVRSGAVSLPGGAAPAIQRKIDGNKPEYVKRRVIGELGAGTIVEMVGEGGYTVQFDAGPSFYVPADQLDFLTEDTEAPTKKKKTERSKHDEIEDEHPNPNLNLNLNVSEDVRSSKEPFQPYHHGMASAKVLGAAAKGVASDIGTIKEAGEGWAGVAIQSFIKNLQVAYPGMPPIALMSQEDTLQEKQTLGESSPDASFHEDTWEIYVDPKYLVMELSPESLCKLAEFVVHEMRHADQYWRAAMMRAEMDETDEEIQEGLGIPMKVVKLARKSQKTKTLALQNEQLMEAEAINRVIPLMDDANEQTKQANAYEVMSEMAQEHLDHEEGKWKRLTEYSESGDKQVLISWFQDEQKKLEQLRPKQTKLLLALEDVDEESTEAGLLGTELAVVEKQIEFAEECCREIKAFAVDHTLDGNTWQEQILKKIEEHETDLRDYKQKIFEATEAYRKDALENDARWCGETFAKELRGLI